jgi:lysophospholipase L1-like esterase
MYWTSICLVAFFCFVNFFVADSGKTVPSPQSYYNRCLSHHSDRMVPLPKLKPHNSMRWESEIRGIQSRSGVSKDGIAFIGSSTIRLWRSLKADFTGFEVSNCGFGGSFIADSTHFAQRILVPLHPRQVVIFAGSNDIANGHSPHRVALDFRQLIKTLRRLLPVARLSFIAIFSAPTRYNLHFFVEQANEHLRNVCLSEGVDFIPAQHLFAKTTPNGHVCPDPAYFQTDALHLNPQGYAKLATAVRPFLLPLTTATSVTTKAGAKATASAEKNGSQSSPARSEERVAWW